MGIKRFGLKPIHTQIGINIFMKPMKRLRRRLEMVREGVVDIPCDISNH